MRWILLVATYFLIPADLTGSYELQSMGADRQLALKQKGNKLIAHRVMWPEFEGEKYKLEHLYRGHINGNTIKGKLLVREDEVPEYEVLRDFTAVINEDGSMTFDGMPLKKLDAKGVADAPEASDEGRASDAPSLS